MNHPLATYLKSLKASSLERKIPNISEENAEFIKHLIREKNPKHLLEIGTANGYSSLCFYEALIDLEENSQKQEFRGNKDFSKGVYGNINEGEKSYINDEIRSFSGFSITTIEYAANAHREALEHLSNCKVKNIHAIWGDAKAVIPSLADNFFDFLYIDAMKREYLHYLLLSLSKLTEDAIIVIDDVEKFRYKMENLYSYLDENAIKYTLEKTDVDDSIMILYKKDFLCDSSPV